MTDYNSLKVPELKKMLGDRSLPLSGNKADLIARLQEDDKPKSSTAPVSAPPAEDEIDWDEDDTKIAAPEVPTVVAVTAAPLANPVVVPSPKLDVDPPKANEVKVSGAKETPATGDEVEAPAEAKAETAAVSVTEEAPKRDYSMGLAQTDAEKEAAKRAARGKRFGIVVDDEEQKRQERAKKFGSEKEVVVKGLDDALPERTAKRGREADKQDGRAAKRQTPDRRTEVAPSKTKPSRPGKPNKTTKPAPAKTAAPPIKKATTRVQDDPSEKAKAEARAKRFQTKA